MRLIIIYIMTPSYLVINILVSLMYWILVWINVLGLLNIYFVLQMFIKRRFGKIHHYFCNFFFPLFFLFLILFSIKPLPSPLVWKSVTIRKITGRAPV